jgi:hypothetical protein
MLPSFLLHSFLSIFLAFTAYSFLYFRLYSVLISSLLGLANPVPAPSVLKDVLCFICFINTLKAKKKWKYISTQSSPFYETHCFQDGSQTSPACPNGKSVNNLKLNMQHWRTDTDGRKPNYLEKNQFQRPSHTDWPGIKPAPTWWKTKFNLISTLHLGYRNKLVNAVEGNY